MSNPFDFFDQIYCIHLPRDKERRKLINTEFKRVGINDRVHFIHADPPDNKFQMSNMERSSKGEFGVNLSQIKAVVHAAVIGAKHPLFLEDDIIFSASVQEKLSTALTELPEDWDILYLGGHPRGRGHISRVGTSLVKVSEFSFADSYVINNKMLLKFFDVWVNKISKPRAAYDCILGDFAAKCNSYSVYPIVCDQRNGISGITNVFENKKIFTDKRWKGKLARSEKSNISS